LRWVKPETTRERQDRPRRIFVSAHWQFVGNTIMATNSGRGGGG